MITEASKRERERDILDNYFLGQISKPEAEKLLTELNQDHYEAMMTLKLAERNSK